MNLSTVSAMFDAVFPTLRPELQAPLRTEQSRNDEAFVAEHIARRAPVLQREYAKNRAKVAMARLEVASASAARVGEGKADATTDALMAGDFAEVGRLEAVAIDRERREQAEDVAELEAQELLDAREVGP